MRAVHMAAASGNVHALKYVVEVAGCDASVAETEGGRTPMSIAKSYKRDAMVEALMALGVTA